MDFEVVKNDDTTNEDDGSEGTGNEGTGSEGTGSDLLPVRSNKPVPREKLMACMDVIRGIEVQLPVKRYDVIVADICGTGADIVATKTVG